MTLKNQIALLAAMAVMTVMTSCGSFGEGLLAGLSSYGSGYGSCYSTYNYPTYSNNASVNAWAMLANSPTMAEANATFNAAMNNMMSSTDWSNVSTAYVPTDYSSSSSSSSSSSTSSTTGRYESRYGDKDCYMCLGTGDCQTCNGTGHIWVIGEKRDCPNCTNGVCSKCHGTKKVYGLK